MAINDSESSERSLARTLVGELESQNVSHVAGIPDNSSAALFRALDEDSAIEVVRVSREAEAFAIASGLWLGGRTPVVLIQNTGLLESGDSLRGTAIRMGVPLVCLVTYRGYGKRPSAGEDQDQDEDQDRDQDQDQDQEMTRADIDSAAVVTEATLDAWRVPYELYRSDADVARVQRAFDQANALARPVALLLTQALC